MNTILAVAIGGAIGALARHGAGLIGLRFLGMHFPYTTLFVNVVGSLLIGLLIGLFAHIWQPSQEIRAFLVTGFLGGFTTFSAFSLDTVLLYERGELALSALYVVLSLVLSIGALFLSLSLVRSISL